MRLHTLTIKGFRKLRDATITFGDATWLLGPNNCGKSSVLRAIDYLLSGDRSIPQDEWYSEVDTSTGLQSICTDFIELEAEFRNVPLDADQWRGFKGRIFTHDNDDPEETGRCIFYRKIYSKTGDAKISMKSLVRVLKDEFKDLKNPQQYIDAGAPEEIIKKLYNNLNSNITAANRDKLLIIDEIFDLGTDVVWDDNPGGIPGNVLSKLPRFLLIPAEASPNEIGSNTGALQKTLSELFADVRDSSENYKAAQAALDALEKELDPNDGESDFGKMMGELNGVLSDVFPDTRIHATADLSDPNTALRPTFKVTMASNVRTGVSLQGTGMLRSAIFGLLRFRQGWISKRSNNEGRSLIICFEEPEIYLHPSAANQLRNVIYELSSKNSQIIATTHSPYMIDLSRKPRQVLNKFTPDDKCSTPIAFSVSKAFRELSTDDKRFVKMILKVDDYVARAFFTKKVVIVEGDTEDIVIRQSLERLYKNHKDIYLKILSDFEIIKARGKAAIISLSKYLRSMNVDIFVVHDRDQGTSGAEVMNQPIIEAVGDASKVIALEECIEDVLGYAAPTVEKPYRAFKHSEEWGENWDDLPENLRKLLARVFHGYLPAPEAVEPEATV